MTHATKAIYRWLLSDYVKVRCVPLVRSVAYVWFELWAILLFEMRPSLSIHTGGVNLVTQRNTPVYPAPS